MSRKQIVFAGLAASLLCVLSIFLVDRPVAEWVHASGGGARAFLRQGTSALEILFGWSFSKLALGLLLLGAGVIAWLRKPWRDTGRLLLFVSLAHLGSRLLAGTLKNVFERLRPYEVITSGDWHSFFAADGNSFPSTHSAHFWSLFFPLALAFPRYRLWFSIVPLFISIARIGVNDHFVSDVLAGAAVAAFMTWALSGLKPSPDARISRGEPTLYEAINQGR